MRNSSIYIFAYTHIHRLCSSIKQLCWTPLTVRFVELLLPSNVVLCSLQCYLIKIHACKQNQLVKYFREKSRTISLYHNYACGLGQQNTVRGDCNGYRRCHVSVITCLPHLPYSATHQHVPIKRAHSQHYMHIRIISRFSQKATQVLGCSCSWELELSWQFTIIQYELEVHANAQCFSE